MGQSTCNLDAISGRDLPAGADPARAGLQAAGDGSMWLAGRFRARLHERGLGQFEAVIGSRAGRCLRVLHDRENWYFSPQPSQPAALGMYLKKHHVRTWVTRVRAGLGAGAGENPARVEARHARALADLGIAVMPLVAYGERLRADGTLESFLLTEELAGYEELQAFVQRRFSPGDCPGSGGHVGWALPTGTCSRQPTGGVLGGQCPPYEPARPGLSPSGTRRQPELRRIIAQVAEIARRFHAAGYNHRDFYCCHFLIREVSPGSFDIRLIDLQRAQRRRWFRRRWIVKDLAQLAYSAPAELIGCRERVAWMRRYLGVRKLGPADKRLVRAVARKVRAMQRRLGVSP